MRKMNPDWPRSLRDQCVAAGVPFFFKKDSYGNHELDGRTWEQFPHGTVPAQERSTYLLGADNELELDR
jgi:protein gp37